MTTERETRTRIVLSWLREDAHEDAERVLLQALDEVDTTPQRRHLGAARRSLDMPAIRIALTAAAVLAVAFFSYRLIADPSGPGGVPSPSPTPAPTTPVWVGPGQIPAGRWAMDIDPVRVSFDAPAGWEENSVPDVIWHGTSDGRFGFTFVTNIYAEPCGTRAPMQPPIGPTVDDLATALASLPGIPATGPTDITLGGHRGKLVDIDLPETADPCPTADGPNLWTIESVGQPAPLEIGARTRVYVLDIEGSRLVIVVVERAAFTPVLRSELQGILDSFAIEP
jgi:hypothetical protein